MAGLSGDQQGGFPDLTRGAGSHLVPGVPEMAPLKHQHHIAAPHRPHFGCAHALITPGLLGLPPAVCALGQAVLGTLKRWDGAVPKNTLALERITKKCQ